MKSIILFLLSLLIFQICISGRNHYLPETTNHAFDSLNRQLEKSITLDENPFQYYPVVRRMYQIARQNNNSDLLARTQYWESYIQLKLDNDSAESLINEALEKTDSVKNKYDYARMLFNLGIIQISRGNYLQGYLLNKKLENYFLEVNDYLFAGKASINIGYILNALGECQEALEYFLKAKTLFQKGNYKPQRLKNELNIANILSMQGKQEEASDTLMKILKEDIVSKDTVFCISVIVSLDCMSTTKEKHCEYSKLAYQMAKQKNHEYYLMYTSNNLGAYYLKYESQCDSALIYFRKAYAYLAKNKDAYITSNLLQGLSDCYACLNKPDSAYHYLIAHNLYEDSLAGNNKIIEINRIESKYTIDKYESELRQAQEKTLWHRKMLILIVSSFTVLSLLIAYIFLLLHKKGKIERQLKETENRELREHLKTETLQNERFQVEIDSKNRELTSNTLIIAEKNQTLKRLIKEIELLGTQGILPMPNENSLKNEIKGHLANNDEWKFFKIHFEKVHPDFFVTLKNKFPSLSENELHLCAYIRIGMSSKQIATMLSVLPETINMARYRMRKKIEIPQETSLEDFLRAL